MGFLNKIEVVVFDPNLYAIRKTKYLFGLFKSYSYMDLRMDVIRWRRPGDTYFSDCLTRDSNIIYSARMVVGITVGTPIDLSSINAVTLQESIEMNKMAQTDEGLRDLMLKAKEFYLLKRK